MLNDERNPNDQIRNNPPAIAPSSFELLDSFVIRLSSFVICGSRKGKRFPMNFSAPPGLEAEIDELITHYPQKRSASLMALHAVQEHFGWISREAMEWIAVKLDLQPINVCELVTFYPMFRQEAVGKYQIKVCRTLSCALGGSNKLHEHFCRSLGLDPHRHDLQTTRDGSFSVEFVECLAGCGTAPVMMCNEDFYEGVGAQKADDILTKCK